MLGNAHGFRWVPWAASELSFVLCAWAVDFWVVVPAKLTAAISLGTASIVLETDVGDAIQVWVSVKAD